MSAPLRISGTLANRPDAAAAENAFYFATDDGAGGKVYVSDDKVWFERTELDKADIVGLLSGLNADKPSFSGSAIGWVYHSTDTGDRYEAFPDGWFKLPADTRALLDLVRVAAALQTLSAILISQTADPTDGQILAYNATDNVWKPTTTGPDVANALQMERVIPISPDSNPNSGDLLVYDATLDSWKSGRFGFLYDGDDPTKKAVFDLSDVPTNTEVNIHLAGINGATTVEPIADQSGINQFVSGLNPDGTLVFTDLVGVPITVKTIKTVPVIVNDLPSASASGAGTRAFVTDANTTLVLGLGTTVVGGNSNKVPVYSDGTNWIIG
jgi:hypothetical protein